MTFVSQYERGSCALNMMRRINRKFKVRNFLLLNKGYITSEIGLDDCTKAIVHVIQETISFKVTVTVLTSAEGLFKKPGHNFGVTGDPDGMTVCSTEVLNQTEAKMVEKEIKKLVTLHLYRSRETRLSKA